MYFNDSSSEEEEDDNDFKLAVITIIQEEDIRKPGCGSQIGRI